MNPITRATLLASLLLACGGDDNADPVADASADASADTDAGDATADAAPDAALDGSGDAATEPDCDTSLRPIVAAHGFLASGDTWANHAMRFEANGLCPGWFVAFDWNTLDRNVDHEGNLAATIDALLADTGATEVDLFGHSAGGGLGYDFLADPEHAARVAHYVHIGSFRNDGPAGPDDAPVPTLNVWSPDDRTVEDGGDIEGATNASLPGQDHYQVATSVESFEAIYPFLRDGAEPTTTAPEGTLTPRIAGRALSLGENEPNPGASIEVWQLDDFTGQRAGDAPVATLSADERGYWGPLDVEAGVPHELVVTPEDGTPVHYYREPFGASNPLVYLRTLPSPGTLAGVLVSVLPLDAEDSVLIVFSSSQALDATEDSLTLDGLELSREETTDASNTTIALFLYDANGNGETDDTIVDAFASFPFFAGVDIRLAGDRGTSELAWNDRLLRFPRLPADEEGAIVVVFD